MVTEVTNKGSVYYDKTKKRWYGQYITGRDANGKVKKKKVGGKTKKEAQAKLNKLIAELETGVYVEPSKITVIDIATALNEEKKEMNIIAANAYKRNVDIIRIMQKGNYLNCPVQQLKDVTIKKYLSTLLNYSDSVIGKVYSMINRSLIHAKKVKLVSDNVMGNVNKPKSRKATKKVNALTVDEEKDLIDCLNQEQKEPYRTMLLLTLFTGARMGEICALDKSSIDLHARTIKITRTTTKDMHDKTVIGERTKTYAGIRTLKMNVQVYNLLSDYISHFYETNKLHLLFVDKNKNIITTNQVNSYYKRLVERYDISNVLVSNQHQLRHTYATRCIEAEMPAKVLQHLLGHTDITTTLNTYCDVFEATKEIYIDQTNNYFEAQGLII